MASLASWRFSGRSVRIAWDVEVNDHIGVSVGGPSLDRSERDPDLDDEAPVYHAPAEGPPEGMTP